MRGLPPPAIGEVFGRLTVLANDLQMPPTKWQEEHGREGTRAALTRCECGQEKLIRLHTLRSGKSASCGCLKREQTLAMWQDPAYVKEQKRRAQVLMEERWQDQQFAADVSRRMAKHNHLAWADPA